MKHIFVFCLLSFGLIALGYSLYPASYPPAAKALRMRGKKRISNTELLVNSIAEKLQPLISIDSIKRARLSEDLKSLGYSMTPEVFQARALAKGIIYGFALIWMIFLSPILGLCLIAFMIYYSYSSQNKKLKNEIEERREQIERELPQFAGTIRQSLNSTRDVVGILESYRKVCGKTLLTEIDRTLNDMKTGNPERALKALESRVSSAKLSELVRGLISVMRGDDQKIYFEMLSVEYQKAQNEAVKKELLRRPEKLKPNMAALFLCMAAMLIVAIGYYVVQQAGSLM